MSDIAETEPKYTVDAHYSISYGMLTPDSQTVLLALPITFFCLESIRGFFPKLDPLNAKSISVPTPF